MELEFIDSALLNSDLKSNKTYVLISAEFNNIGINNYDIKFRVCNENGVLALYSPEIFNIVNPTIDNDFIYKQLNGSFELIPISMSYPEFWERFFDSEEKEINLFKTRFPEYSDLVW